MHTDGGGGGGGDGGRFVQIPWGVLELVPVIGSSALTVYVAYRRHRNNDPGNARYGLSWPSVPTIARELGLNEKTVKEGLATLIACGLLVRHSRPGHSSQFAFPDPPSIAEAEVRLRGDEAARKGVQTQAENRPGSEIGPARKSADDPGRKTADTQPEKRPTELDSGNRSKELLSSGAGVSLERILELQQMHAPSMPPVMRLDDERRRLWEPARQRFPDENVWRRGFVAIEADPFLRCGEGGSAGFAGATLDWLMRHRGRNLVEIVEGKYSRTDRHERRRRARGHGGSSPPRSIAAPTVDELAAESAIVAMAAAQGISLAAASKLWWAEQRLQRAAAGAA